MECSNYHPDLPGCLQLPACRAGRSLTAMLEREGLGELTLTNCSLSAEEGGAVKGWWTWSQ